MQAKSSSNGSSTPPKKSKTSSLSTSSWGVEITSNVTTHNPPSVNKSSKKKVHSDKEKEPKQPKKEVNKPPKQKGEKIPEEVAKILQEWTVFEKQLAKKKKAEKGRGRSSTLGGSESDQLKQIKSDPNTPQIVGQEEPRRRAFSVSDGIELAAQKTQQRKERQKRNSLKLQELNEEQAAANEESESKKSGSVEMDPSKLRGWRTHMNEVKNKSREDYVAYYKTISKKAVDAKEGQSDQQSAESTKNVSSSSSSTKRVVSGSLIEYYLTLRGIASAKADSRESSTSSRNVKEETVTGGGSAIVDYYLALRGQK